MSIAEPPAREDPPQFGEISRSGEIPEALIPEAREVQRRRWRRRLLLAAVALGCLIVAAIIYVLVGRSGATAAADGARANPAAATAVAPKAPTTLALGPRGALYVEDPRREQILERLPEGRFKVAVGTGVAGYSGDGGPATRARIAIGGVTSMVTTSAGDLYFVQSRSTRRGDFATVVREVTPDGQISTVIGAHPSCTVAAASARSLPAQAADLNGGVLTIAPNGELSVLAANCVRESHSLKPGLFDLTPGGRLVKAPSSSAVATANGGNCTGGAAYSGAGALYIACWVGGGGGPNGGAKGIRLVQGGHLAAVFGRQYPSYDGPQWLTSTPDGSVLALAFGKVLRVTPSGLHAFIDLDSSRYRKIFGTGRSFRRNPVPNGIAVDRRGNTYLAMTSGQGDGTYTGIIEVHSGGRVQVLWSNRHK